MIVIIEQDVRRHNGKRFVWKPGIFKNVFNGKNTWRICWGLWSLSYYNMPGLKDFFDYVEKGNTTWMK